MLAPAGMALDKDVWPQRKLPLKEQVLFIDGDWCWKFSSDFKIQLNTKQTLCGYSFGMNTNVVNHVTWAHKSLSLGQNGSHCPLREQHITYRVWTSSFLFYWFYRDFWRTPDCVFVTLYYTKQSKIIIFHPIIIISKNSHLKCYFSFFPFRLCVISVLLIC